VISVVECDIQEIVSCHSLESSRDQLVVVEARDLASSLRVLELIVIDIVHRQLQFDVLSI
jgi:hypothetical protein